MPLGRCMRSHTHREFLVWQAWLSLQWNRPDRTDHYLMMITREIRSLFAKSAVSVDECKVKFSEPAPPMTKEQAARMARQRWFGLLGMVDPDEEG